MGNPLVSIIVPMYNVEKYVRKCLESIHTQTFKDFEVIMVNDGSPDNSAKIALEYAEKDNRFILVNQENKGLGGARNTGIDIAKGKYICFIDSDDFCSNDYIEKLYNAVSENNADIACCVFSFYYEKNGKTKIMKSRNVDAGIYDNITATANLIKDRKFRAYVWNKMFKTELFKKNNIKFPSMLFEDTPTTPQLMHFCNKLIAINDCCYYYVVRDNSIVSSHTSFKKLNDYIKVMGILRYFFEKNNIYYLYKSPLKYYGRWKKVYIIHMLIEAHIGVKSFKGIFKNLSSANKYINYMMGDKYTVSLEDNKGYTEITKKY